MVICSAAPRIKAIVYPLSVLFQSSRLEFNLSVFLVYLLFMFSVILLLLFFVSFFFFVLFLELAKMID